MLSKNNKRKTDQVQIISVEQFVPKNHILRKIDKYIDFDFIYELVEDKYSLDNGRPSIDPVVLIKILFIEYLFNIKSMRQTIKEIEVNIAYRWFLGLDFYDKVPHFTTFSQNYRRRFKDTNIFEEIFQNILSQAMNKGFVDEKIQFVDSTHVKAHANRHKNKKEEIKKVTKAYQEELDKEIEQECLYETEGYRYTKKWKEEYKRRKETLERQFGSAKEFHGFRYTNMIGLAKMEMKAALTFAYINMKKLAILLYKLDPNKDLMLNKLRIFLMNILKMQQTQEIFLGLSTIWQVLFYTCFLFIRFYFQISNLKS